MTTTSPTGNGPKKVTPKGRPPARSTSRKGFPLWPVLIGVIVVLGVLAVVLTTGGDDDTDSRETAPVTITGDPLPPLVRGAPDDAIGSVAPTLSGENFAGAPVTIPADDGNAKAIFFVAHWCPHCQAEVPRLAEWLETHELPAGLDIDIVSTLDGRQDGNAPASEWLAREGLGDVTTMVDDPESSAYAAYGAGGLPFVVYLDAHNEVVLRTAGEYPDDPEIYTELFADLAAGETITDPRG